MTDLILHHYDASPFTQRALRMLGLKKLAWRSVQMPMMPPKDDLAALTGGYRGTPVLQVGAAIYVDSQLIARELERLHPAPTLFPGGPGGLQLALVKWSDAFFRAGLKLVLGALSSQWPEPFRKDREHLFPDIDFGTVGAEAPHWRAQYRAHAALLEQQLADGRAYLGGTAPGLADIHAHPFVAMLRGALPEVAASLLDDFAHLRAWEARVAALGEGVRTEVDAPTAHAVARASRAPDTVDVDPNDAQGLRAGMTVEVEPDDTLRGGSRGELVIAKPDRVAIRRTDPRVGTVVVHFPRLGYRVTPLG
ncbi:MAG: glutathione S-transferase family protein [Steroidobacteraceae bacterium]|nr:glutathione S-transferase family protein [Steroidobacteraceae bacterium]